MIAHKQKNISYYKPAINKHPINMKRCKEKEKRGIYTSLEVLRQATRMKKIL